MTSRARTTKTGQIDIETFLSSIRGRTRIVVVARTKTVYKQGTRAGAIFLIQKGKVRLSIASPSGRAVTIGTIGQGNFFGEGALAGQLHRMSSATAMTNCQLVRIEKKAMITALRRDHGLSGFFLNYLLVRKIRYEEDLIGHLFNVDEKALARALLLMTHFGRNDASKNVVPKISAQTIAGMIGSTRSRVNVFIKRFAKLGLIQDKNGLRVHNSLLNAVLHD